jgi:hypothetical protein
VFLSSSDRRTATLKTRDKDEAFRLVAAKNENEDAPAFSLHLARVYWKAGGSAGATRPWQHVMDEIPNPRPAKLATAGSPPSKTRPSIPSATWSCWKPSRAFFESLGGWPGVGDSDSEFRDMVHTWFNHVNPTLVTFFDPPKFHLIEKKLSGQ